MRLLSTKPIPKSHNEIEPDDKVIHPSGISGYMGLHFGKPTEQGLALLASGNTL